MRRLARAALAALDGAGARRALALAVIAVAVWGSLTPMPPKPPGLPQGSDLLVHFAMHAAVAAAALRAWPRGAALGLALALAVGLEAAQLGVPGRTFSLADLAANLTGLAAAAAVSARMRRVRS